MRARRIGLLATAALIGSATPALGVATSAAAAPRVSAVVAVAPGVRLPFTVPGGRVVTTMPRLGTELVHAPASSLSALAGDPRVLGISPDRTMKVAGNDNNGGGKGVLAPQFLGGAAGKPGTGDHVTVALLDTGVSDTPALNRQSGRLQDGIDVSRLADGGDASKVGPFTDGYGHGTFMASLIAGGVVPGSGNRAVGVAPAAHVVVVKVAGSDGTTTLSEVLAGLDWVASNAGGGIQVVNLSLAQDEPMTNGYGADPLTAAVEHVRAAGVLVVVAAGNHAGQVGDPGDDPQALTVGAVNVDGPKAHLTNFSGADTVDGVVKPDVVAPGRHVLGVINPDSVVAQNNPQADRRNGLFLGSGTSESTAITSGVAAAYLSQHPNASPLDVKTAMRTGAQGLCKWGTGAGLVTIDGSGSRCSSAHDDSGVDVSADPTGEANFNARQWEKNAWLNGQWEQWLASSWSASSWSASSWSASSWSASSWSASSWSASSWSASSWSASSWSDAGWGDDS